MCEKRKGGTIYGTCRDQVRTMLGGKHVSNKDMRRILEQNGGCFRAVPATDKWLQAASNVDRLSRI